MATAKTDKKIIGYRDLFVGDFWRYFVKSVWLFFPAILFLLFGYMCFWELSQGKDVMIITLENRKVFGLFLLALIFWVVATWYSSRLVGKAKAIQQEDKNLMWRTLRIHAPRILGFTCITIIILAFFQLPYLDTPKLSKKICYILLFLSFSWYFIIYQIGNRFLSRNKLTLEKKLVFWNRVRFFNYAILLCGSLAVILTKWVWGLIILLLFFQLAFLLFVLTRRNIIDAKGEYYALHVLDYDFDNSKINIWRKLMRLLTDNEDRRYFQSFIIIGLVATTVYVTTIVSVQFSTWLGTFPFLLLAFGILVTLGNLVAMLSILARFNFHLLFLTLAFIIGYFVEPHYTRLIKNESNYQFAERQNLKEYFNHWIHHPDRQQMLLNDSIKKFPIFFVMANGGASRSGYWTASVLSKLEDETKGDFSKNLFCLSGASGGSIGNGTFFSLLRSKDRLHQFDTSDSAFRKASTDYLKSDFLTYTLARTLGPDVFRNLITLYNVNDRASALSHSIEEASGPKNFLYDSLGVPFTHIITQKNQQYNLPIICINTTRMQDGSPGVISNIKISDSVFNGRIDVLGLLNNKQDMKLSTGIVLGASFPYLSPAGRIDHKKCDTCPAEANYFVDGGYFDNSGAGVVFEMIFDLQRIIESDTTIPNKNKIEFHVIHITNDLTDEIKLKPVNPLTNDLAAPFKTLLGAYGTQTSVNDLRLKTYINNLYNDKQHYNVISLYKKDDKMDYTMSWVISKYVLNAIDERLRTNDDLDSLIQRIKSMNNK